MMKEKKPKSKSKLDAFSDYRAVGYVFLIAAIGMFFSETTRPSAIVFFILGITFMTIEQDSMKKDRKSNKKKSNLEQ